jgi:hypothetical protein
MEEAPENGKESLHSVRANGMIEHMFIHSIGCAMKALSFR